MIEIYASLQSTTEKRVHFVDFTNDLPAAVTVSTAAASLVGYPAGGTTTLTVGVIANNIVPVTVDSPTLAGTYTVNVTATLSDAETSTARLIIPVSWAAVRATMQDLIQRVREMTNTSVNDWTTGGVPYWSDKHLQDALDQHKAIVDFQMMVSFPERSGAAYTYKRYYAELPDWELSPVVLDSAGGTIASGYTFDPLRGEVLFTADQAGSVRFISGTVYDLNLAAADVWSKKAAHYAEAYNVSAGGQSLARSQLLTQAQGMARFYRDNATAGKSFIVERGDC